MSLNIGKSIDQAFDVAADALDAAPVAVVIAAGAVAAGAFVLGYIQAGKPLGGEAAPQED